MSKTHFQEMVVPQHIADAMEDLCANPRADARKFRTEFDEEVEFDNGVYMVVQVCGPGRPEEEPCWTQGVLISKDGFELGCTDVGESFLGEYCVTHNDEDYVCLVRVAQSQEEKNE